MEPDAFEQLVVDLLIAMGYGGTEEDAGRAIGQSNDGGVDGAIMEDVLGLVTIYIRAKRWKNTVPITEIRDFAGAQLSAGRFRLRRTTPTCLSSTRIRAPYGPRRCSGFRRRCRNSYSRRT